MVLPLMTNHLVDGYACFLTVLPIDLAAFGLTAGVVWHHRGDFRADCQTLDERGRA